MTDLFPVTLDEQIEEVKYELAQRKRVYARRILNMGMTPALAERHTRRMEAVLATLEGLKATLDRAAGKAPA